jgi:hypothetical protein
MLTEKGEGEQKGEGGRGGGGGAHSWSLFTEINPSLKYL